MLGAYGAVGQGILTGLNPPPPPGVPPGSRQIAPGYWQDPFGGVWYPVQEEVEGRYPGTTTTRTTYQSVPLSLIRDTLAGGSSGSSPEELALAWAKFHQDNAQFLQDLELGYARLGVDANTARQAALRDLIINRQSGATDVAQVSLNAAEAASQFAANPRDAMADLYFRRAMAERGQGGVPYGTISAPEFEDYQSALARRFDELYGGSVAGDLAYARERLRDPFPAEFGAAPQVQLYPEGAGQVQLYPGAQPAAAPAPAGQPNGLQALMDRLRSFSPQEQEDFRRWTDPDYRPVEAMAVPQINLRGIVPDNFRSIQERAITNSEGGLNINVKHPAYVVDSVTGDIITTLAERDPVTGQMQPEQLIVKPLKSVQARRRENEKAAKAMGLSPRPAGAGVPMMQDGGSLTATPDDYVKELREYLATLGGAGGGPGRYTPGSTGNAGLYDPRLLAGAPYEALLNDPDAMGYAEAAYSSRGVSPNALHAAIKRYTPTAPSLNMPRVSWA